MLCLKNQGQNNFKWVNYVESILNRAGLGYIFINQVGYCDKTYPNQILTDQFVSSCYNDIENSSRGQESVLIFLNSHIPKLQNHIKVLVQS
jgi:hypothetical protein